MRASVAGQNTAILAHTEDKVKEFLQTAKFIYSHLPDSMKPKVKQDNTTVFSFGNTDGSMVIGTARSSSFSRGGTYQFVHGSEVAWWKRGDDRDTFVAISESVPRDGCIVLESTANGRGGLFFDLWQQSITGGEYKPHFFSWWEGSQYFIDNMTWELLQRQRPLNEEESQLVARHNLSPGQIAWRREAIQRLDEKFYQEYPEDDISTFLSTGSPYFPSGSLRDILQDCRPPVSFDPWSTWRPPYLGGVYLIGADVGGGGAARDPNGVESGDRSAASVIDCTRGRNEYVASLSEIAPPDVFAGHLADLGKAYNKAMLVVEKNSGFGQWVINKLLEIGYPNIAMFQRHTGEWDYGWVTTPGSKPSLLADFHEATKKRMYSLYDQDLVNELLNIVDTVTPTGRHSIGATSGHDDLAMAAMIAWYNRELAIDPRMVDLRPSNVYSRR